MKKLFCNNIFLIFLSFIFMFVYVFFISKYNIVGFDYIIITFSLSMAITFFNSFIINKFIINKLPRDNAGGECEKK